MADLKIVTPTLAEWQFTLSDVEPRSVDVILIFVATNLSKAGAIRFGPLTSAGELHAEKKEASRIATIAGGMLAKFSEDSTGRDVLHVEVEDTRPELLPGIMGPGALSLRTTQVHPDGEAQLIIAEASVDSIAPIAGEWTFTRVTATGREERSTPVADPGPQGGSIFVQSVERSPSVEYELQVDFETVSTELAWDFTAVAVPVPLEAMGLRLEASLDMLGGVPLAEDRSDAISWIASSM